MKILSVGDVHTKSWMIYEISEIVDLYDAVVFCGDYSDEFNASPVRSISTWRLIRELVESNPKVHALIGNHDYAYIHPEIAGRSSGWSPVTFTLINVPENKKIKEWLLSLPVTLKLDGVTFSHAGITNEWNGKEDVSSLWNDVSPIWARPREFGGNVTYKEIPQVFGHSPGKTCIELQPNAWCIDTFSEDQNNNNIGDQTMLEIIDGKEFNVINIKEILSENNSNTSNFSDGIS